MAALEVNLGDVLHTEHCWIMCLNVCKPKQYQIYHPQGGLAYQYHVLYLVCAYTYPCQLYHHSMDPAKYTAPYAIHTKHAHCSLHIAHYELYPVLEHCTCTAELVPS